MILYNGQTGGLGRYLAAAARDEDACHALRARLGDRATLRAELARVVPLGRSATLVQMAAMVSVAECEASPVAAFQTNVVDTADTVVDFAGWAAGAGVEARVVYVSSGHVYAPRDGAIDESWSCKPRSIYAQTKLDAEDRLRSLAADRGFSLVVARVFGLLAPQQPPHYVLPGLIRRARARDVVGVPGLDCVRDYLDARDVCRVIAGLARFRFHQSVNFNVCSGVPVSIRQILLEVASALGVVDLEPTPAPGRPDDVACIVGDPSSLAFSTGLETQTITLRQTIRDAVGTPENNPAR